LITSGIALDLGRTVASVPGPIDSPRHVGSNRILFEGASFIARVEDVLPVSGIAAAVSKSPTPAEPRRDSDSSDELQVAILSAVRAGASDVEDLARSSRLAPRDFAMALATLELRGQLVVDAAGGVMLADHA
jgi:DNA processing protein